MSEYSLTLIAIDFLRIDSLSTQEKIIHSAVALFIEHGVAATTTRAIATHACVSEGSIYRYYPSKEEMAWQIFRDYHHHLAEQLSQSINKCRTTELKINALVHCFFNLADEDWLMFRYYLTSQHTHMSKIDSKMLTPYQVISDVVEQGLKLGEINKGDTNMIAAMAMGAVHQVAINKNFGRIQGALLPHKDYIAERISRLVCS